eukprot:CAMPEP_0174361770 /NCGR_PEP_ID=MMETSP0811_2-20130205/60787_1 /TAXON_ID=73025 ORGANISM="Eutreptiella gymnastica-like, Strain CCMP1594" /NCGR_SAMPLE_ID=MMETSP0811_2 /ASSEMBLY_ACC=CAM_ASM_000667 /LENGTH=158 /DNA_ID=CAMNT_0015498705 /DNA_START=94 /DNA_END=570 /DNA_ORIENTATION=-
MAMGKQPRGCAVSVTILDHGIEESSLLLSPMWSIAAYTSAALVQVLRPPHVRQWSPRQTVEWHTSCRGVPVPWAATFSRISSTGEDAFGLQTSPPSRARAPETKIHGGVWVSQGTFGFRRAGWHYRVPDASGSDVHRQFHISPTHSVGNYRHLVNGLG